VTASCSLFSSVTLAFLPVNDVTSITTEHWLYQQQSWEGWFSKWRRSQGRCKTCGRQMECPSTSSTSENQQIVPELVDGPVTELTDDLLCRLREKSAQSYVVSIDILSLC